MQRFLINYHHKIDEKFSRQRCLDPNPVCPERLDPHPDPGPACLKWPDPVSIKPNPKTSLQQCRKFCHLFKFQYFGKYWQKMIILPRKTNIKAFCKSYIEELFFSSTLWLNF